MKNLKEHIGNTGMVEIPYENNVLHLKIEAQNPGLSIKDRVAFHICQKLDEKLGGLRGKRVIEYSSGNLAIGLAQASKVWGFDLTLIVTSKTSPDKINLLRHYGANLIMVDEEIHSEDECGFRGFAVEIAKRVSDLIFIDQFNNPLNPDTHYSTTAPEIFKNIPDIDYVFSAMGTGATASGIAKFFKEQQTQTKVVGVTPDAGVYYTTFHGLKEERPMAGFSLIEGVGEDFIPKTLDLSILETVMEIRDTIALQEISEIMSKTGLFLGGSSGLALAAAKEYISKHSLNGKDIVVMCPDSGNRYLSTFQVPQINRIHTDVQEVVESFSVNNSYPKIV